MAGNLDHPGSPDVRLNRGDGALCVAEAGWQGASADRAPSPHWGIGAWRYSRPVERLDGAGTASSSGLYVLGQASLAGGTGRAVTAFLRAGAANRQAHPIEAAITTGISVCRPWGSHGPTLITAGEAVAFLGRTYRHQQSSASAGAETTIEGGARWQLGRELAIQPIVQRVWHPAGRTDAAATIVGVRRIWSFAPRAGA